MFVSLCINGCYSFEPNLVSISVKERSILQCDLCPQVLQLWVHVTSLYEIKVFLQFSVRQERKEVSYKYLTGQKYNFGCLQNCVNYLYCSCVSRSSFFSSSILSVVSLRTMTSSMVSTTSPFSPRLRLEERPHFHIYKLTKKIRSNLWGAFVILTWELLWLPAALSIGRHSAKQKQKKKVFSLRLTFHTEQNRQKETWALADKTCWFIDFFHLLWKPVRWTPRLWERLYGPTYRHPARQGEKFHNKP